jgi:hypothetical protein
MALILISSASLPTRPAILEVCGAWESDPEITPFFAFKAASGTVVGNP